MNILAKYGSIINKYWTMKTDATVRVEMELGEITSQRVGQLQDMKLKHEGHIFICDTEGFIEICKGLAQLGHNINVPDEAINVYRKQQAEKELNEEEFEEEEVVEAEEVSDMVL